MSQIIHKAQSRISGDGSSSEGDIASLEGFVFGKVALSMSDGSAVPSGNFQLLLSMDGIYFEAARDASNSPVAVQAFDNTNKLFNVSVESFACKSAKIKMDANLTAGPDLIATFYGFDNS